MTLQTQPDAPAAIDPATQHSPQPSRRRGLGGDSSHQRRNHRRPHTQSTRYRLRRDTLLPTPPHLLNQLHIIHGAQFCSSDREARPRLARAILHDIQTTVPRECYSVTRAR